MGHKRTSGLIKRGKTWHIDKTVKGQRICESTGTTSFSEAERFLALRLEQNRQAQIYGVRRPRTFDEASAKFVQTNQHKQSLDSDIVRIKGLMPWIGDVTLERLNIGTLQPWIESRQKLGNSVGTINHGLKVVRRILNLAATEWFDEYGQTWLQTAVKIRLLPDNNKRQPYPLNWDEQTKLFKALPEHLARMALFAVNTGCRDQEICRLRWEWEIFIEGLDTSVFSIPGEHVKNGDDRIVVLNKTAKSVIESVRGEHSDYVFTYKGNPRNKMLTTAWKRARTKCNLEQVRVHDLKHTFGRRLRSVGVSFEDRQDLLGHRSGRITTHYSAAELTNLIEAANKVCDMNRRQPELVMLRRKTAA